eukprot:1257893-Alexandrium_andersonii.AAC.1
MNAGREPRSLRAAGGCHSHCRRSWRSCAVPGGRAACWPVWLEPDIAAERPCPASASAGVRAPGPA